MGKFSNALQGNLNDDKGPGKGRGERQLDLFLSLSDRPDAKPRLASSHLPADEEPAGNAARPEPEMVLPPPREPPDVSAEVRAVLSESGPPRPVENTDPGGTVRPPLRTGIYRRPPRRAPPAPVPSAPRPSGGPPLRRAWGRLRDWLGEVDLDRRMVSLVVLLVLLVAIAAFWSACPRSPEPGTTV
ncbi:MAG TPA: hypothetical protein PLK81_00210, partial [Kiritimatiellia bacterium]|nr:hypothetical protein [Kiritimatiellia bacterium]